MPLKLLSLNVEGDNHYEKIFPFFEREKPDVICLMEFWQVDLPLFEEKLQMKGYFVPLCTITKPNPYRLTSKGEWGIAIFSRLSYSAKSVYYKGDAQSVPELVVGNPNSINRALLSADVEKDGEMYHLATTHFTWADNGGTDPLQLRDLEALLPLVAGDTPLIFCGDFNAPRGLEIFSKLSSLFTDNIPQSVTTTMDNANHRVGHLLRPLVVDGLFTRGYTASNVRVISGVSDHCAVVGEIS